MLDFGGRWYLDVPHAVLDSSSGGPVKKSRDLRRSWCVTTSRLSLLEACTTLRARGSRNVLVSLSSVGG